MNPSFTLVIFYNFYRYELPIHAFIIYSSQKYVKKAAIGQLPVIIAQPKNIIISK